VPSSEYILKKTTKKIARHDKMIRLSVLTIVMILDCNFFVILLRD
jgi:hypothetical protein